MVERSPAYLFSAWELYFEPSSRNQVSQTLFDKRRVIRYLNLVYRSVDTDTVEQNPNKM